MSLVHFEDRDAATGGKPIGLLLHGSDQGAVTILALGPLKREHSTCPRLGALSDP